MKYLAHTILILFISLRTWSQERVDITTCAGTGTGIVCVAPSDSLYKLCVIVTPGPCTDKNYTIDWGDGKTEKVVLNAPLTISHEYNLKNFVRDCSSGEFKATIFAENATCKNDNKGFRVTFNKNPQARPAVNMACEGSSISLSNQSCPTSSDIKFLWQFSDGRTSSETYPYLTFTDPDQAYKVKLTATSANCGTHSSEMEFKLKKKPVAAIKLNGIAVISADTVVCASGGGVVELDGTVSTDESGYQWQISGGQFTYLDKTDYSSPVLKVQLKESKEYTFSLTARNECGSKTVTKKLKMVDLPRLSLSAQPDVCEEISYTVPNPIAGAAYELNGKAIDPSQSIPLSFSATPYIISAKLVNACGTQILADTFTVGQPQSVEILTFPHDTTICVSPTPIPLKANIPGGTWSTAGIQTQNGQKVFVASTQGEYTISYSNGVGKCFSEDIVKVKVDGLQATAVDQTICEGTPFIKLQATPAGGSWSTSSCQNCLKGDTLLTSAVNVNQVDLTYSVSNGNGCRASAAAKVTMGRPKAQFTLNGGCTGTDFQPNNTSSGAGSYTWMVNGVAVSSVANPQLSLSQGLQKITLIARSGNCADTIHHEVKIIAPPATVSFLPSITTGCSPLAVTLNVNGSPSPDTDYTWDLGNGTTFKGFQPPAQVFENSERQNKSFKIVVNAVNSCGTQADSKDVVVRPKARAEIGVDSTTLRCAPAQMLFSNRSSGHDKPQSKWFFGDGTQRQTGSDTVYHTFAAGDNVRTYRVRLEVSSGCGQDTTSVEIKVYPTTVKALFTISKSIVCPGEEVKFIDASVPKPNKWVWKFGDGSIASVAAPSHSFSQPQKNYTVTLIAYTACGFDSTQLVVKTTEALSGSFADIPLACEGSEVKFNNKSDSRLGFVWDFGDGSALDSANYSPGHVYTKTGNYTATLSVYRDTQACKAVAQRAVVSVVPGVTADFGFAADSVFCAPGPVTIENRSKNADTFWWAFSDGRTSTAKNPALPFDPGMYGAKLVASKGGFCKDSVERAAAVMVEHCQVDIPTAFTPNGDGHGEKYTLFGTGIQRIERLLIRDRWGEIVFEMKDVPPSSQQPGESWDGTFKGKPLPADMYVYEAVIRYSDNRVSEKLRGNLYLIRQ